MRLPVYRPPDASVLWRVAQFGRQETPAGRPYWWRNEGREPPGTVVLQATLGGSIRYRDPTGERLVQPGSLMVFSYGETSDYGQPLPLDQAYKCAWICLAGAGLPEHLIAFRQRHGSVIDLGLGHPLLTRLDGLIALAEPQAATPAYRLAAATYALVMALFEHAEHGRMERLSPVEQAIEFVLRQPHATMSVDDVAAKFGCSREHLSRSFHAQVGRSPAEFIANAKRRRALRLLRETDLAMTAIAEQCGYATTHTLARHIREETGLSPTQFRARREG